MQASVLRFQDLFTFAKEDQELALSLSFVQVEWGLEELETIHASYVDSSIYLREDFDSLDEIVEDFKESIGFHRELAEESTSW